MNSLATSVAKGKVPRWRHAADPGRASDFIDHLPDAVTAGDPVVILCRVSHRNQSKNRNLLGQVQNTRRSVCDLGAEVVAEFSDVASGWVWDERTGFRKAIQLAQRIGATVVAESTDRLIRSKAFHSKSNPGAQPTQDEFLMLQRKADGVQLATILHPDTPWREVRGVQSRRGQIAKKRRGGRPRKETTCSKADPNLGQIVNQHGGKITVREAMRSCRALRPSAKGTRAALIAFGMCSYMQRTRGRPKEVFRFEGGARSPCAQSEMHSRNARRIRLCGHLTAGGLPV
jgi:hypothetical protein